MSPHGPRATSPHRPPQAGSWRGRRIRAIDPAAAVLMALRVPAEAALTSVLRRTARHRPELFDRLGDCRQAEFLVEPTDFPVNFRLRPDGVRGVVRVVRRGDPTPCTARISGPLLTLLELFDGGGDADSAFFTRRIRIAGDTAAVIALHNTLEAAELTLGDLLGAPALMRGAVNAGLGAGLARLRGRSAA